MQNNCILDMDDFIKTLSEIKDKKIRPDLIGSIITGYASKWLPELAADVSDRPAASSGNPSESVSVSWSKKRFIIESLVGILPHEKDSVPTDFLLRILRAANVVRAEPACVFELERRVSWQLDQASLKELMIPSFSHTSTTLLDVELVLRLVRNFVSVEEAGGRGGAAAAKVAKLVDSYLAEAALDSYLALPEFVALASAVPGHARLIDDGLYRAIDTYLKAHPGLSKKERKTVCSLIDCSKLSQEACLHAAQNDRLPVRAVIQVLLSEQSRLVNKHIDWSGTLSGPRSPGPELSARCFSKRDTGMEMKMLKEEVLRLQSRCMAMEKQIQKLSEKKTPSFLSWKKLRISAFKANRIAEMEEDSEAGFGPKSPSLFKPKLLRGRTPNRRKSMS
ncbi:root phototropism protein 3-like [Salvia miltiorrhiza]|uniref:root phototropism protein 3-like n=1 Tax=Salvia miltiorrhiza TaxID=226208 RepID=UPI0025ACA965|nr:root phototropism protein 3-like [Salvia miltiorrhiza]